MNSDKAREVLLRYRPGTSDDADPEVCAALDRAAQDPELASWLESHAQFQQAAQKKYRDIPVPAGVKEQILSERKVRHHVFTSPKRVALAVLVTILIVAGLGYFPLMESTPDNMFANYRMRMVKTALRGYAMDVETTNEQVMRDYLTERKAPVDAVSFLGLTTKPLMGCAVLKWQNRPVTLVCYGEGAQPDLWLFVAASDAFPDPPTDSNEVSTQVNRLNTVSWSRDGRTYLLAGLQSEAELLRFAKGGG